MKGAQISAFLRVLIHLAVLRPLVRLYCGVRVSGSAHLHGLDRFIIIANHNSHLDILLLFSLLSARDISSTHAVADEAYFARSRIVLGLVRFLFQPLWVHRGRQERGADPLAGIKEVLDRGHNVILFPEGTRGQPGQLLAFKPGVGRVVSHYPGTPVVPVFLLGPERVLPKACWIPLPFWSHVIVGPPQVCTGSPRDITRHLHDILAELSRSTVVRRRPRQRRRQPPAPTVAILGIDGSGKSTLSRLLARALSKDNSACLVSDALEFFERGEIKPLQPLGVETVRSLVGRYAKRARTLGAYKIPKLAELMLRDRLLREVNRWYAPGMIVQDGSPLLNMAAWTSLYRSETLSDDALAATMAVLAGQKPDARLFHSACKELPELRQLDRLYLTHLTLPRALVLLDLPAPLACARIAARGGARQAHETEERLGRLRHAYLRVARVVSQNRGIRCLVADGQKPLEDLLAEVLPFVQETLAGDSKGSHGKPH